MQLVLHASDPNMQPMFFQTCSVLVYDTCGTLALALQKDQTLYPAVSLMGLFAAFHLQQSVVNKNTCIHVYVCASFAVTRLCDTCLTHSSSTALHILQDHASVHV